MTGKAAASYTMKNKKGDLVLYAGDRLTRDQLEIAVEKHRDGKLVRGGEIMLDASHTMHRYDNQAPGCIMQHINQDPFPLTAFKSNSAVAAWFDDNYQPTWADWMLREAMMKANLIEE